MYSVYNYRRIYVRCSILVYLIYLSAIILPVCRCNARRTAPLLPLPRKPPSAYEKNFKSCNDKTNDGPPKVDMPYEEMSNEPTRTPLSHIPSYDYLFASFSCSMAYRFNFNLCIASACTIRKIKVK